MLPIRALAQLCRQVWQHSMRLPAIVATPLPAPEVTSWKLSWVCLQGLLSLLGLQHCFNLKQPPLFSPSPPKGQELAPGRGLLAPAPWEPWMHPLVASPLPEDAPGVPRVHLHGKTWVHLQR